MRSKLRFGWMACLAALTLYASPLVLKAQEADGESLPSMALAMENPLGLTADQVVKLKAVAKEEKGRIGLIVIGQLVEIKKLDEKTKAGAPDTQIKPILDRLVAGDKRLQMERHIFVAKARAILTPTQAAKITLLVVGKRLEALKKLQEAGK